MGSETVGLNYLMSLAFEQLLRELVVQRGTAYKGNSAPPKKELFFDPGDDIAYTLFKRGIWAKWRRDLQGTEHNFEGVITTNQDGRTFQVRLDAEGRRVTLTLLLRER